MPDRIAALEVDPNPEAPVKPESALARMTSPA